MPINNPPFIFIFIQYFMRYLATNTRTPESYSVLDWTKKFSDATWWDHQSNRRNDGERRRMIFTKTLMADLLRIVIRQPTSRSLAAARFRLTMSSGR